MFNCIAFLIYFILLIDGYFQILEHSFNILNSTKMYHIFLHKIKFATVMNLHEKTYFD